MNHRCLIFAALLVAAFATGSMAQEQEQPVAKLTGTLAKVNGSGKITLGYREASFPFSYLGPAFRELRNG